MESQPVDDRLLEQVYESVLKKIRLLAEEPRPDGALKLKGMGAEYLIRIGEYRLRYKVDDENQVVVLGRCQHRNNVHN